VGVITTPRGAAAGLGREGGAGSACSGRLPRRAGGSAWARSGEGLVRMGVVVGAVVCPAGPPARGPRGRMGGLASAARVGGHARGRRRFGPLGRSAAPGCTCWAPSVGVGLSPPVRLLDEAGYPWGGQSSGGAAAVVARQESVPSGVGSLGMRRIPSGLGVLPACPASDDGCSARKLTHRGLVLTGARWLWIISRQRRSEARGAHRFFSRGQYPGISPRRGSPSRVSPEKKNARNFLANAFHRKAKKKFLENFQEIRCCLLENIC
jgi:hypothetical protein